MLKDNKKNFEGKIRSSLEKGMYNAFYSMFSNNSNDEFSTAVDDYTKKTAKMFSKKFADSIYKDLADAIDEHIKSADIYANVSPSGILLSNAGGMCAGTITISPQTAIIEIK